MKKYFLLIGIVLFINARKSFGQSDMTYDSIRALDIERYKKLPVDSFLHAIPAAYNFLHVYMPTGSTSIPAVAIEYKSGTTIFIKPGHSGLDSASAWSLERFKKDIANNIYVIHPSNIGTNIPLGLTYSCDTASLTNKALQPDYGILDTLQLTNYDFYMLSRPVIEKLWFKEIENIGTTKFTSLWNSRTGYRASHFSFMKHFENRNDVKIAFQFGPNHDLWGYLSFIVKKINSCYIITRSYFRHARFTGKSYSILDEKSFKRLCKIINRFKGNHIDKEEVYDYCAYFLYPETGRRFYVNLDKKMKEKKGDNETVTVKPKRIRLLYDFIDKEIKWIRTYK